MMFVLTPVISNNVKHSSQALHSTVCTCTSAETLYEEIHNMVETLVLSYISTNPSYPPSRIDATPTARTPRMYKDRLRTVSLTVNPIDFETTALDDSNQFVAARLHVKENNSNAVHYTVTLYVQQMTVSIT